MTRLGIIGILATALGLSLSLSGCGDEKQSEKQPKAKAIADGKKEHKPQGDAARRLLFEKRCNEGHFGLCGELGVMWEHGYGGEKNKFKADEYYGKACDHAIPKACEALDRELKPEDQQKIYQKDCEQGNGFGCNNLGHMLLGDMGVPKDEAKAREYLDKGCSSGFAASCFTLNRMLLGGVGGPVDNERAASVMEKAKAAVQAEEALKVEYLGTPPRNKLPMVKPSKELTDHVVNGTPIEEHDHNH
jgi:TPR repeat protein